jgi:hypothetical protein
MSEDAVVAKDLVINGWQPMASFPKDTVVYETQDAHGNAGRAHWWRGQMIYEGCSSPVMWRPQQQ